jgi:uncharacterized protein (DUF983 family)
MLPRLPHRACPQCRTPVGWRRFLLQSGIWVRWHCPSCGCLLKFSWKRRLLFAILIVVMIVVSMVISFFLVVSLELPPEPVVIVVSLLLMTPLLLLDGVEAA